MPTLRTVARERLVPLVDYSARPARLNRAMFREIADAGLLAPFFASEYGGSGDGRVSATLLCQYREALAMESTSASSALATQIGGVTVLASIGSDELRNEWVPSAVRGDIVTAIALTEPGGGSDAAHLSMPARRVEGGWSLTGEKIWIMNAPDADVYTVFARTTPDAGARGLTAFLVPGDSPGLSASPIDSAWDDAIGRLRFEEVFVPDRMVLGEIDRGFATGMAVFDTFRPSVGAFVVGFGQTALEMAVEHARTREAFGSRIGDHQGVSHLLAEMATRLAAARHLVYDAAAACDTPGSRDIPARSAMAKLFATEAVQFVVDSAVQIFGAAAMERGHLLEHLYREVRLSRIYEGTSQIQRNIIARSLLDPR